MDVNTVLNWVSTIIWFVVGISVAGAVIWWALIFRKYNKLVVIHDLTGQSSMIREVKAREKFDDKNILCWYLKGENITVPCPPKEAISIKKGKKYATLVRVRGDQYHWVDITAFTSQVDGQSGSVGRFFVIAEDAKRQLADQIKKAEQEKQTKFNDLINKIMPIAAIGILLVGAYFIYDAVSANMAEMGDRFASAAGTMAEVSKNQAELMKYTEQILEQRNTSGLIPGQPITIQKPAPN